MTGGYRADDLVLLAARRRNILNRLSLLSEAPAAIAFEQRDGSGQGHGGASKPPPETRTKAPIHRLGTTDRPPSRDLSLYEHYRWRFEKAQGDPSKTELLCIQAELAWRERVVQRRPKDKPDVQKRRVVNEYRGVASIEVAVFERMSRTTVRRWRQEFGFEPEFGDTALRDCA